MSLSTAKRGTITVYAPPTKSEQEFMYSGKAPGMTFEAFDECVLSWGRNKFGERFAKALWRNELVKLEQLDLTNEFDEFKFEEYCNAVYEVILLESPKWADSMLGAAKFKTVKFQCELQRRFRERLFCFVEQIVYGEARRQLQKMGVAGMAVMRRAFFIRFGAGQPEVLKAREERYRMECRIPRVKPSLPSATSKINLMS